MASLWSQNSVCCLLSWPNYCQKRLASCMHKPLCLQNLCQVTVFAQLTILYMAFICTIDYLNCFHILPGALGLCCCCVLLLSLSSWSSPLRIPSCCNFLISCANIADVGGADSSCNPLSLSRSAKNGTYTAPKPTMATVPATATDTILFPDMRAAILDDNLVGLVNVVRFTYLSM
jgi:hypothetical protein